MSYTNRFVPDRPADKNDRLRVTYSMFYLIISLHLGDLLKKNIVCISRTNKCKNMFCMYKIDTLGFDFKIQFDKLEIY